MEEWTIYRLGDVINVLDYMRVPLSSKQREFRKGNYPYYGAQGIIDYVDSFLFDGEYLLIAEDGENLKSKKQNIAQIARGRYWVNNHAHIVESNGRCDIRYICYLLNQIDLSGYITGSAQPKLNQANLLAIELRLPCLEVQKRVSDFLATFDDKIELNNRINHNLEEQAQALYKSWFVDFEPFRDGKFVESELGMIPEGWRVGSIYEYAKVIYGAPYKSSLFNESGDGLPLIRIRDLKDCSPQFYSPEVLPNTEYVLKGDIVAGMDADFTPYIWKGSKGLLNQRVCKFVPISESISRYYIMMMVKPELEFVSSYKVGTTVSHLGKSDIDRFTVLLPPVEVIERYSRIVDSILEQIVTNSTEAAVLTEQRNTLLPQLMSGKITC